MNLLQAAQPPYSVIVNYNTKSQVKRLALLIPDQIENKGNIFSLRMGDVREKAVSSADYASFLREFLICSRSGLNSIFSAERENKTHDHGAQKYEIDVTAGRRSGPFNGNDVKNQLSTQMLQQQK